MKRHSLIWFIKRIGQKLYRDRVSCGCASCLDGFKNGVLVHDRNHAEYLHTCQCEMGIEYRDRKENK